MKTFEPGVATGKQVKLIFAQAKASNFAIPAVNVTNIETIIACLESAKENQKPIIIQLSYGGSQYFAGKNLDNSSHQASIQGAIAAANYVHSMAKVYSVTVILHTDHCARKVIGWMDGLILANQEHFKNHGRALFSSHMLDLSAESLEENLELSSQYFKTLTELGVALEIELGVTGGEEDGVDNSHVENAKLYTQPSDVWQAYQILCPISQDFSIAASFGNVHGVYKPGNVKLEPIILKNSQDFVKSKLQDTNDNYYSSLQKELGLIGEDMQSLKDKPLDLVFHGGSGSTEAEVKEAVGYGVVKMNVDTDTQWSLWEGVKNYYTANQAYLQSQLGNPEGADKPNKKHYDPRVWLSAGKDNMKAKIMQYYSWLSL